MAPRPRVPDELTHGPFNVAQARAAGLSKYQLEGASWRRVRRGWYVFAGTVAPPEAELAAVMRSLPPGAAIAGLSAARIHGLDVLDEDQLEIIVPPGSGVSARVGVRLRRVHLDVSDVNTVCGLSLTTPLRTCFDLACRLPLMEAIVVLDAALHRRLVAHAALRSYVEQRTGMAGTRGARHAVELAEPAAESPMESRLRLVLVLAGLPRPAAQVTLHDEAGRFLARPDLYYPRARLAIEYDGATHRDNLVSDNRRQNRLQRAGIRLLRYTATDVYERQGAIVADVKGALAGSRGYPAARMGAVPGSGAHWGRRKYAV